MDVIKKILGAYLAGVAMVVAVWFIINSFFVDSFSVLNVWHVLDVLMLIGLAIGLVYNYDRKRRDADGTPGDGISRRYLEANVAFYLTAGPHNSVPAQLVFPAGPRRRWSIGPGRGPDAQPPGLGHLGVRRYSPAIDAGRDRVCHAEGVFRITQGSRCCAESIPGTKQKWPPNER